MSLYYSFYYFHLKVSNKKTGGMKMFINLKFMKTSITNFRSYEDDFIMLFMIAAEGGVVAHITAI